MVEVVDKKGVFSSTLDQNPGFVKLSPLRKLGADATMAAKESGIRVLEFHLGNPSTKQQKEVAEATVNSVSTREAGYSSHFGTESGRKVLAEFFNDSEGVAEGYFDWEDVAFVPGGTFITKMLSDNRIFTLEGKASISGVLVSKPGYGPYYLQVEGAKGKVVSYQFDNGGIITFDGVSREIDAHREDKGEDVGLMIINYPNNPTGKTLNEQEAKKVADVVNKLAEKYPQLVFYNDAIYSATVTPEMGYNSFYPHLTEIAQMRTVTGMSGSKMTSQAGERIGGFACKNKELMKSLCITSSTSVGGVNVHAEAGLVAGMELLKGTFLGGEYDKNNPRHEIAMHYAERRNAVEGCINEINEVCGTKFIEANNDGAMYIWADFSALKGMKVPKSMVGVLGKDKDTIETGSDLTNFMLNLNILGFQPVALPSGELFGCDSGDMHMRIGCVAKDMKDFETFAKSLKGAVQVLTSKDLGVVPSNMDDLEKYVEKVRDGKSGSIQVGSAIISPLAGGARQWSGQQAVCSIL